MKWGHNELARDLASYLRGNSDRLVWTDMQMGPAGSPRPDVFTLQKSYSKFRPLSYECKVSIADFRRDITAGKWQSYLQYSAGVIFAVPAGLVKKEDIPAGCGLLVRHEESWRTVKGPTMQVIKSLPHDAWMKLMIDGLSRLHPNISPRCHNEWLAIEKIKKKYGANIGNLLSNLDQAEDRITRMTMLANTTAEELRLQEQERVARIRKSIEDDMAEARKEKLELCKAIGLPENASNWAVTCAVRDIKNRINETGEVKHLRDNLEMAMASLKRGYEDLPIMKADIVPTGTDTEDEL